MVRLLSRDQCCGCHACASICPKNAITMERDKEGFLYPVIDGGACVACGRCEKACPLLSEAKGESGQMPKAYAAWNTDEDVRKVSSSGGVFTAIAECILDRGGVVFGAALDDARAVRHIAVERKEDLALLRGSKYLQSTIGDAYRRTREYLLSGRAVLFSGTPCQIGGLRAYLGKDYENLFCQDIVCHGVPSSAVWEKALSEYETSSGKTVSSASFRSKSTGWKGYSLAFTHTDGSVHEHPHEEDPFMTGFIRDLYLRPSCYRCSFKGYARESDLTLADFWGIEHVLPAVDDDRGTSLILVHTARGETLLQAVKDRIERHEVNVTEAARYNPSMLRAAQTEEKRAAFLSDLSHLSLSAAVKKHTRLTLMQRGKRVIKRVIKKILSLISK